MLRNWSSKEGSERETLFTGIAVALDSHGFFPCGDGDEQQKLKQQKLFITALASRVAVSPSAAAVPPSAAAVSDKEVEEAVAAVASKGLRKDEASDKKHAPKPKTVAYSTDSDVSSMSDSNSWGHEKKPNKSTGRWDHEMKPNKSTGTTSGDANPQPVRQPSVTGEESKQGDNDDEQKES